MFTTEIPPHDRQNGDGVAGVGVEVVVGGSCPQK
jgi:hypothetical protein